MHKAVAQRRDIDRLSGQCVRQGHGREYDAGAAPSSRRPAAFIAAQRACSATLAVSRDAHYCPSGGCQSSTSWPPGR